MNKAVKYLESKIKETFEKYQHSFYAGYEYDFSTETFFVKIEPEIQYSDKSFNEDLVNLMLDFEIIFPEYSLCFVSDDSLVKMENPLTIVSPPKKVISPLFWHSEGLLGSKQVAINHAEYSNPVFLNTDFSIVDYNSIKTPFNFNPVMFADFISPNQTIKSEGYSTNFTLNFQIPLASINIVPNTEGGNMQLGETSLKFAA